MSGGPFYPDNADRHARVIQLINQTATIQDNFSGIEKQMDDDTKVTAEALAWVANEAGYPSIEKYAEAGMSALTPAQRKNFNTMLDSISASNKTIKIGLFIGGSVGTIGAILQYGIPKIVAIYCKTASFLNGLRGILRGIIEMVKGSFVVGLGIVRQFWGMIKINYSRTLVAGEHVGADIGTTFARNLRWLGRVGRLLKWAGIFAEIAFIIYNVVEGKKEAAQLKDMIKSTFSSRFSVKKIHLLIAEAQTYQNRMTSVIKTKQFFEQKMKDQKTDPDVDPKMKINPQDIDKAVKKEIDKLVDGFEEKMKAAAEDDHVVGALKILDDHAGATYYADDPTLAEVKQYLQDHPLRDGNGNVIKLDEQGAQNIGLAWRVEPVQANTADSTIRFVGTNDAVTKHVEDFTQFEFEFQAHPDPSSASSSTDSIIVGTTFGVKSAENPNPAKPYVEISSTGAVAGLGVVTVTDQGNGIFSLKLTRSSDADQKKEPGKANITVPPDASITIAIHGLTTAPGEVHMLLRETWYPAIPKWVDLTVKKS